MHHASNSAGSTRTNPVPTSGNRNRASMRGLPALHLRPGTLRATDLAACRLLDYVCNLVDTRNGRGSMMPLITHRTMFRCPPRSLPSLARTLALAVLFPSADPNLECAFRHSLRDDRP